MGGQANAGAEAHAGVRGEAGINGVGGSANAGLSVYAGVSAGTSAELGNYHTLAAEGHASVSASMEAEATAEFTMTNLETGYEASVEAGVTASGEVSSSNRHGGASLGAEACAVCAGGGLNFNAGFDGCTASVGAEGSIKLLVGAEVNGELSANFCEIGDDLIKGFEELGQLAAPVVDKVAEEIERHVWNQGLKPFGEQIGHSIEHNIWNNGIKVAGIETAKVFETHIWENGLKPFGEEVGSFFTQEVPNIAEDIGNGVVNAFTRDIPNFFEDVGNFFQILVAVRGGSPEILIAELLTKDCGPVYAMLLCVKFIIYSCKKYLSHL